MTPDSTTTSRARLGPDFNRLFGASTVSNLGDGVLLAAGPLLVASLTREPVAVAAAVFAQQLPWLLFALVSGAVVDRLDRRRLVVLVDSCRGAVLVLLTLWLVLDTPTLWSVYVALFLLGLGETLADNAGAALVASVVEPDLLGKANSRIFFSFTITNQLFGPPIGAFLFALGTAWPMGVDAASFVIAAVVTQRIRHRPLPGEETVTERRRLRENIGEGLVWLWRHPGVRTVALAILVMNVTFMAAFATWVLYARVRLGLVVETLTHLSLALTRNGWVAAATMFVFGVHALVWGTVSTTVRQRAVPKPLHGRVTSVYLLAAVGGAAVGALLGGGVAQLLRLVAPFWFAFVAMAVFTALAWQQLGRVAHKVDAEKARTRVASDPPN